MQFSVCIYIFRYTKLTHEVLIKKKLIKLFIINFILICSKVPLICSKVPLTWGRFEQNRRIFKNIKVSLIFNENVQFCYYMLDKYVINAVRCLQ